VAQKNEMIIPDVLAQLVQVAIAGAQQAGELPRVSIPNVGIERPQNPEHGDFATSLSLKLAKPMNIPPMDISEIVVSFIPDCVEISSVKVTPPGFINFRLDTAWVQRQVGCVIHDGVHFGNNTSGDRKRVQIEFVSVNPTGPIHVGHARGAVMGSTLASVLKAGGYAVTQEYYVNDAGSQIENFARSLLVRYQQAFGRQTELPENGYAGSYVSDMAGELIELRGENLLDLDESTALREIAPWGIEHVLKGIERDLESIRVKFDSWFSERTLFDGNDYELTMKILDNRGYVVKNQGATWFRSQSEDNEKDNVLIRSNGAPTYFASDAAYHYNKFLVRNYEQVINIWGADHHGHVNRLKSVVSALGVNPEALTVIITQLVALKRGNIGVRVSKRTGDFVTLQELVEEVGSDACRYFFLARSPEAQMEFDLDLAVRRTQENPVYYIQYAHARIAGILRQAKEQKVEFGAADLSLLQAPEELQLIRKIIELPEIISAIIRTLAPHHLPYYTLGLATSFHWFYDRCRVISDDTPLTWARLKLVDAARVSLSRCLSLMGMDAPDRM